MALTRLQKILADRGVASRRKAEELIEQGHVRVNGHPAKIGDKADDRRDVITVRGKRIDAPPELVYLMLHKPRGYITTLSDENGRKCVADLVRDVGVRVYPIGRLDKDSEGLLLFTNDGDLLHRLISPKKEVPKLYYAKHEGTAGDADVKAFAEGITLGDGTKCLPATLQALGPGESLVTVCEGKYHQVRRMLAGRQMPVTYLERLREGDVCLGDLPRGQTRELTDTEISALLEV